jgi:peptide/nickel transport system permease protein
MRQYLLQRLGLGIFVAFLVMLLVFLMINAMPGDAIETRLAGTGMTREQIDAYKEEVGLNRPLYRQFFSWMGGLAQGDLGESLFTGRPVREELSVRLLPTIELGLLSLTLAMLIAIPLGTISAVFPNSVLDYVARVFAILGLAVPNFFLAVLAILALSKWFNYFPPIGFTSPFKDPIENFQQIWLPVVVLGVSQSAGVARMTRSSLLEVLRSDYIRTARAKGLRHRIVILRHGLRNALIPVVTIMGLQAGGILGGVVIAETLFNIPGMGQLVVTSVLARDFIPLQSVVLLFALVLVGINLLVDMIYPVLDPRISYS